MPELLKNDQFTSVPPEPDGVPQAKVPPDHWRKVEPLQEVRPKPVNEVPVRFVNVPVVANWLVEVAWVVVALPIVTPPTYVVEAAVLTCPNVWSSWIVPVVVIVPPVMPFVVATLVTPELPAGVVVAITDPWGLTARKVPAGTPSEVMAKAVVVALPVMVRFAGKV